MGLVLHELIKVGKVVLTDEAVQANLAVKVHLNLMSGLLLDDVKDRGQVHGLHDLCDDERLTAVTQGSQFITDKVNLLGECGHVGVNPA